MQIDHQRAALRYQNKVNNAQGHFFEQAIKAACALYASHGRATADKTPEPFRVLEKSRDGIFKGRFTARAQPDFQGTLAGGRDFLIAEICQRSKRCWRRFREPEIEPRGWNTAR